MESNAQPFMKVKLSNQVNIHNSKGSRPSCSLPMGCGGRQAGRGALWIVFEALTGCQIGPMEDCSFWVGPLSQAQQRTHGVLIWFLGPLGQIQFRLPQLRLGCLFLG